MCKYKRVFYIEYLIMEINDEWENSFQNVQPFCSQPSFAENAFSSPNRLIDSFHGINHLHDISQDQSENNLPENKDLPLLESPTEKISKKLQKKHKIRSNKNSQKIYHHILGAWMQENGFEYLLRKYGKYFNRRVYFLLILNEISKKVDSSSFEEVYEKLAGGVIQKKECLMMEAELVDREAEYVKHLKRVIEEIKYSIESCRLFLRGSILSALKVVFQRNQTKITKNQQFRKALTLFEEITRLKVQDY